MLDIPQCTEQPQQQRIFQAKISIVLRFKKPGLKGTNSTFHISELWSPLGRPHPSTAPPSTHTQATLDQNRMLHKYTSDNF